MTCPTYAAFRKTLEIRAAEARAVGVKPERFDPFQRALELARYHRENCPACDAEMVAAFPELARMAHHNEILSHEVSEVEA